MSFYKKGDFAKAAERFREAQELKPGDFNVTFNLGDSYYKQGNYQGAIAAFGNAGSGEAGPGFKEKVFYNIGNAFFRLGKLEEAIASYKKALEINPNDMDAKFNLEFVKEQLKKQPPKKRENQNQPDSKRSQNQDKKASRPPGGDRNPGNQPPRPDKEKTEPENRKEDHGTAENPDKNNDKNKETGEPSRTAPVQAGKMTREEAELWLRSLEENPKKFSRRMAMDDIFDHPAYQGNDW